MPENHELRAFFENVSIELASEYRRIYARSSEDPGTAGDEGEANWANLLTDWLPPDLYVTTKGRILGWNGAASPQLDIVVLSPDYPRKLREKKLYLAGGVLAAFECKNTLRRPHINKFFSNAAKISAIAGARQNWGTYFDEAFSPICYGLLAHAHGWKSKDPAEDVDALIDAELQQSKHPSELPDMICVSNLTTWTKEFHGLVPQKPGLDPDRPFIDAKGIADGDFCATTYFMRWKKWDTIFDQPMDIPRTNPISELIIQILKHLTIAEKARRRIPYYYQAALSPSSKSTVTSKLWDIRKIYSQHLLKLMGAGDWTIHNNPDPKNRHHLPGA
ncbi:DUF6602 domain-containing protein [Micromonospora sp. NPDC023888]|uniref:DUF6602 domain-containing protein n=1 Tax=Micromonospora sp. NPDC023888 TaxID=3155607 RepID=UPI003402304F